MKKLVNIEIIPDCPVQSTKDERYLCTNVKLTYKKGGLFNKGLIFETAYPSGTYHTSQQIFQYFNFVNEIGEKYDDEMCKKITNFLQKEKHLGNLKQIK